MFVPLCRVFFITVLSLGMAGHVADFVLTEAVAEEATEPPAPAPVRNRNKRHKVKKGVRAEKKPSPKVAPVPKPAVEPPATDPMPSQEGNK